MFGIGFLEFVLIALLVVVFVKPKDFPLFLRKMGTLYRNLRHTYDETMDYINNIAHLDPSDQEHHSEQHKSSSSHPSAVKDTIATPPQYGQDKTKKNEKKSQKKPQKKSQQATSGRSTSGRSTRSNTKRGSASSNAATHVSMSDIGMNRSLSGVRQKSTANKNSLNKKDKRSVIKKNARNKSTPSSVRVRKSRRPVQLHTTSKRASGRKTAK